jgi:hypothetical protein
MTDLSFYLTSHYLALAAARRRMAALGGGADRFRPSAEDRALQLDIDEERAFGWCYTLRD